MKHHLIASTILPALLLSQPFLALEAAAAQIMQVAQAPGAAPELPAKPKTPVAQPPVEVAPKQVAPPQPAVVAPPPPAVVASPKPVAVPKPIVAPEAPPPVPSTGTSVQKPVMPPAPVLQPPQQGVKPVPPQPAVSPPPVVVPNNTKPALPKDPQPVVPPSPSLPQGAKPVLPQGTTPLAPASPPVLPQGAKPVAPSVAPPIPNSAPAATVPPDAKPVPTPGTQPIVPPALQPGPAGSKPVIPPGSVPVVPPAPVGAAPQPPVNTQAQPVLLPPGAKPPLPGQPLPQAGSVAPAAGPPPAPQPINPPRQGRGFSPGAAAAIGLGAGLVGGYIVGSTVQQYSDVQRDRRQLDGDGYILYREPGRTIVQEDNVYFVRQDETERFRQLGGDVRAYQQGSTLLTATNRPDGSQIITVTDLNGRLLQRIKRFPNGREVVLIDNTYIGPERRYQDEVISLPPPPLDIPRERYIVDADNAPEDVIYETLSAAPVAPLPRRYTLDEVRASPDLRAHMRSVDINSINFDTGSFTVTPDQASKLATIAQALLEAIRKNPQEVYLIEGYTDAVGSPVDNLSLSDRRAESVATLLTQSYNVPPENLSTQGFGAQNLKLQTQDAARENRRVTLRRITPLLQAPQAAQ